jgi:hypothetical protein
VIQKNHPEPGVSRLAELGRTLGRSFSGQLFVAILVAAFSGCLAYLLWHFHYFVSKFLAVFLVMYSFSVAWRILPIPTSTRARWEQEDELARHCRAYWYRRFLWGGMLLFTMMVWDGVTLRLPSPPWLIVPSVSILVGLISILRCRSFVRHTHERNA